ncbi:ATP-binding protein [Ihubacter massiliensis]|uniref:ATP-binding protein n=1 Tax=Hominibacterium faecale TaxID=2839743 RepID=A0A9J6QVP5_9FIRM|nr:MULTISPECIES: ATP-binding protein [Eubacteriales Family XIII. Incertae Sedis]MCO7121284.1 ATP-binding protein [Ihubacter massiliensis]MCU7378270.1 ATP-binding protein [Hominibacterium faecale]
MENKFFERTIEDAVRNVSETFPVLLLTGPRQVGKTTLLKKMAERERRIVSLDDPSIRQAAIEDPAMFLQRYEPPVLIDEVQYAPELFPYIKMYVDANKNCGDFWLTGSQTFRMMKNVTESLAGRVGILEMEGLSNSEINGRRYAAFDADIPSLIKRLDHGNSMSLMEVFERIYKGSMPRLYENESVNREHYFESYLQTYISRDIRDLSQVADEMNFFRFLRAVAARTATNVNYEALANEMDISAPTAKQWLSILVSSGLVLFVQPYFNNALNRVIKAPRMYFLDTGLCAYLTGWNSPEVLEKGAMSGQIFETWVVGEIYKSYLNAGKKPPLYFYRDSNQKEIDLILYQNGIVNPIEIKKASAPKGATKHFSVLKPIEKEPEKDDVFKGTSHLKTEIGTGLVICLPSDIIPIDKKNWYVPAWLI